MNLQLSRVNCLVCCINSLITDVGDECFILRGYAGTGKTTIIGALVKALRNYQC
jgi:tRNA A37 threonylcarbamoyladenosine biosynthesis protein TsaE